MNRIRCVLLTHHDEMKLRTVVIDDDSYVVHDPIYLAPDGSRYHLGTETVTFDDGEVVPPAPAGAMWDGDWYRGVEGFRPQGDGRILVVRTPAGDWVVDAVSRAGSGWTRTGEPPDVTVMPSIAINNGRSSYHGWLRHGWLEEC